LNREKFKPFIGIWSTPVKNEAEKGAIRKFADAIGDPNPLFRDEEYAKSTRFGAVIAPPTFSKTFDFGEIPGLELDEEGLIHGEQYFEYNLPIRAGDTLYCSMRLADVYEKEGKLGNMTFLLYEMRGMNESGQIVFFERSNVIYRG
jgi:acyl dehydratase